MICSKISLCLTLLLNLCDSYFFIDGALIKYALCIAIGAVFDADRRARFVGIDWKLHIYFTTLPIICQYTALKIGILHKNIENGHRRSGDRERLGYKYLLGVDGLCFDFLE